jgi:hypothetical protein
MQVSALCALFDCFNSWDTCLSDLFPGGDVQGYLDRVWVELAEKGGAAPALSFYW